MPWMCLPNHLIDKNKRHHIIYNRWPFQQISMIVLNVRVWMVARALISWRTSRASVSLGTRVNCVRQVKRMPTALPILFICKYLEERLDDLMSYIIVDIISVETTRFLTYRWRRLASMTTGMGPDVHASTTQPAQRVGSAPMLSIHRNQ